MVIEAISSVSNKVITHVSFEGKKHKNEDAQVVTSPLKAIPLAVLIAMSPLNKTSAKDIMHPQAEQPVTELAEANLAQTPNYIESKTFNLVGGKLIIGAVNGPNNKTRINAIYVPKDRLTESLVDGYVTNYNKVTSYIYDDLGRVIKKFNFNHIYVKDKNDDDYGESFTSKDITNYVRDLTLKYNTDVNVKNRVHKQKLSKSGLIGDYSVITSRIDEARNSRQAWGAEIGYQEIQTVDGKYTVRLYSTDNNNRNFERVSIQKENGPKLQVDELVSNSNYINTPDDGESFDLYHINASSRTVGNFSIENEDLWMFLYNMIQIKEYNNAYNIRDYGNLYCLDKFGKFY